MTDLSPEQAQAANTDREIWRKGDGGGNGMSFYEPSIHVTEQGAIGINVGGTVYVKAVEEWHALASPERPYREVGRGVTDISNTNPPNDGNNRHKDLAQGKALAAAQESLAMLRSAWNAHMDRCNTPLFAGVADEDFFESVREWMKAPSDTASASLPNSPVAEDCS